METVVQKRLSLWKTLFQLVSDKQSLRKYGKAALYAYALYYVIHKIHDAYFGPFSKLPGPFRTRFFGLNGSALDKPAGTVWEKLYAFHTKYGTVHRLGPRAISVSDKELIKEVLLKQDLPKGPAYKRLERFAINLFNTTDKAFHKQRRRIISPAFSVKYLKSLEPLMDQTTEAFVNCIDGAIRTANKDGDEFAVVDIWGLLQDLAVDIIGETAFGETFNLLSGGDHVVPRTINSNMKLVQYIASHPVSGIIYGLLMSKTALNENQKLKDFMTNIIMNRLQAGDAGRRNDILQILIDTQKDANVEDRLTAQAIANETVLFLIAGSETTSNTTGFAVIELMRHPHILAKLRAEIDQVPLAKDQLLFTHDQLKELPYLNAVINETMRLDAVAIIGVERCADRDLALGDRLFVPKGTTIRCNLYHAQTNPEYWPEPMKFWPERWLEGAAQPPDTDAFYPFSLGSRNCIGKNFALKEMRLSLATLVKFYDFEAIPSEMESAKEVRAFITFGLKSNSFKIRIKRRSNV